MTPFKLFPGKKKNSYPSLQRTIKVSTPTCNTHVKCIAYNMKLKITI